MWSRERASAAFPSGNWKSFSRQSDSRLEPKNRLRKEALNEMQNHLSGGTGMNTFKQPTAVSKGWLSLWPVLALVAALVFAAPNAKAQSSSATVNGTVLDTSGAVVPDASVTLKNQASGDERTVISNGDGFFNFAAVPPAPTRSSYQGRVSKTGKPKTSTLTPARPAALRESRCKSAPGATLS